MLLQRVLHDDELGRGGVLHLAAVLVIEHVDVSAFARPAVPAHAGPDDPLADGLLRGRHEVGPRKLALFHRIGQPVDLVLRPAHLREQILAVVHRAGLGVLRDAVCLALELHRGPERRDDVLDVALVLILLDEIVERDDVSGSDPRREVLVACEDDVRRRLRLRGQRELLKVVAPLPAALEGRVDLDRGLRALGRDRLAEVLAGGDEVVAPVVRRGVRPDRPGRELDCPFRKVLRRRLLRRGAAC